MKIIYNNPDTLSVNIITPVVDWEIHKLAKYVISQNHPNKEIGYKLVPDTFTRSDLSENEVVSEPFDGVVSSEYGGQE